MITEKKIYVSLDIAKYVMALLILLGHTSNEWAHVSGFWHYALSCDFTVPAFFTISGFLFFNKITQLSTQKEKRAYYNKWSIRIGKMYLIWSTIYLTFTVTGWWIYGTNIEHVISSIHRWLIFSTYATIWFLPALWVGGTIVFLLYTYGTSRKMNLVVATLWVIGVAFGSYSDLITCSPLVQIYDNYIQWFITVRNGIFFGSVYFLLGYYCLQWVNQISFIKSVLALCAFYILFFAEAIIMHKLVRAPHTDMAAFMLPAVFFMVITIAKIVIPPRPFYTKLRNQSMLIFCGQRLFLTAIPNLLPISWTFIKGMDSLSVMLIFCVPVILFAHIVDKLSYRYHILTYLR